MRKVASVSILVPAVLLVAATPSFGRHRGRPHGRVLVNVGPFWGRPYYVFPPPPVIVQRPPVFVQQPPVFVQRPPIVEQQPSAAVPSQGSPAAPPQGYWYYCPSASAFYPTAPSCPDAWIRVPPRPE